VTIKLDDSTLKNRNVAFSPECFDDGFHVESWADKPDQYRSALRASKWGHTPTRLLILYGRWTLIQI